jgi:hypothetical protein
MHVKYMCSWYIMNISSFLVTLTLHILTYWLMLARPSLIIVNFFCCNLSFLDYQIVHTLIVIILSELRTFENYIDLGHRNLNFGLPQNGEHLCLVILKLKISVNACRCFAQDKCFPLASIKWPWPLNNRPCSGQDTTSHGGGHLYQLSRNI